MRLFYYYSTKGFGKLLAIEFVKLGDNVMISSIDENEVEETIKELKEGGFYKLC